jgi:beta-glucanase (GH16 family)
VSIDEAINIPSMGYTTPVSYGGMALVWSDEFDGENLNATDWTFETGNGSGGWGNNELQFYRSENTSLVDGNLIITARKESYMGSNYTSSRIKTQDKKVFQYGRVDIRAVLPKGQGIWPALWMLGNNISSVGWPSCGEIDIMEMVGGSNRENTVYGTAHWDEGGHACNCDGDHGYTLTSGTFNDKFHVFSLVWTDTALTWYVDDVQFAALDITTEVRSELKEESFFIFNVAVGGNWPGNPDATTIFPQRMIVDYIRFFQNE